MSPRIVPFTVCARSEYVAASTRLVHITTRNMFLPMDFFSIPLCRCELICDVDTPRHLKLICSLSVSPKLTIPSTVITPVWESHVDSKGNLYIAEVASLKPEKRRPPRSPPGVFVPMQRVIKN